MNNCFYCARKAECYSEDECAQLTPETVAFGGKYDCCALYHNIADVQILLCRIGEALDTIPKKHREAVFRHIANAYDTTRASVILELYQ